MRALAEMCDGRYLAVVALAALTAACATLTPDSPTEEKVRIVTERSAARWQAVIDGDFAKAYGYLSPATRDTVTLAGFTTIASRLSYRAVKVTGATCEAAKCRVNLVVTYSGKVGSGTMNVNTPLAEVWIIDHGQIWYVWPM